MSIDPEIVSSNSKEGVNAINISNYWYYYLLLIVLFFIGVLVLKVLIESILISLGLFFVWRLASS